MKTINQKMDQAVMNDDFNEVEKIALNPKNMILEQQRQTMKKMAPEWQYLVEVQQAHM